MKLLLNGCSYAHCWHNINDLSSRLGYANAVNIGLPGSSNGRIFRSTLEYLTANNDVGFVVIMLTFWSRFEAPWGKENIPLEGRWVSYASNGITNQIDNSRIDKPEVEIQMLDRYITDRFKFDLGFEYFDKLLTEIITFAGWLDSINMPYIMFNPCEHLFSYCKTYYSTEKLKWLQKNPRIIDVENFLSNQWMYDNGAVITAEEQAKFQKANIPVDPRWAHYGVDGYAKLNDFLYNSIVNGTNTI